MNLLSLVDHYGATFIAFNLVIFELGTFCYIYGVDRICKDIEFMLGFRPNLYWRLCWKYLTPGTTAFLVAYYYWDYHSDVADYPVGAHIFGIVLTFVGLIQLPAIAAYQVYKAEGATLTEVSALLYILSNVFVKQTFSPPENQNCLSSFAKMGPT